MSNRIIAINGESWCRQLTGIERLAIEVTQYLDDLVSPGQMELVVPANAQNVPALKNIRVVRLPQHAGFFPKWTQLYFQRYVLLHRRMSFDYTNTCPFFVPGIEFIHDIYQKLYPADFKTRRDKLVHFYSCLMYRAIARRAKIVFTVSEYTKKTIMDTYGTPAEKIRVVYSGVSSYGTIPEDDSIFSRLPQLRDVPFFFTIGSLSTRKNLAWIAKNAELHPQHMYAISGKALPSVVPPELEKLRQLPNVIMTGYLPDGQVKALLMHCKAFVMPSYFEGFGLPPLEALACGAPIIISNRTSLPEIYGSCAHYLDPDDPSTDLNMLLSQMTTPPDELLKTYTLKNTAQRIFDAIQPLLP